MTELRTLYRHASHYLSGRVGVMLLGFISFPIMARIFSVADYGTISLTMKVVLLFTIIGKFGLQNSIQRFYAEEVRDGGTERRTTFYSTVLSAVLIIATTITLVFLVAISFWPVAWISRPLRTALLCGAALILLRAMQPTLLGFLRAAGSTKSYNAIEIGSKAVALLVILTVVLSISSTVAAFFTANVLAEALCVVVFVAFLYKSGLLSLQAVEWDLLKKTMVFGFPLIGYELASVVLDSGDRVLVQWFLGAHAVGQYSAAYNIATYAEESLMQPINLALFPLYMKLWAERGAEETRTFLSRSLHNFLLVAIGVGSLSWLTSRDLIVVLASSKFEEAHRLLPVLVVGLLIYAVHIFFNAALLIAQMTKVMVKLVVYACCANVLLNLVLIPRLGIMGAAWATLLSYALLVFFMARASFQIMPLTLQYASLSIVLIGAVLISVGSAQVHCHGALVNLLCRATIFTLLYTSFLVCTNRQLRLLVAGIFGARRPAESKQEIRANQVWHS